MDEERRTDSVSTRQGLAQSREFRLGGSTAPWAGALVHLAWTHLERQNGLSGLSSKSDHPNIGIEQGFKERTYVVRLGEVEASPTAGFSCNRKPYHLDLAYVHDMARARVGQLFGDHSSSVILTFTLDYAELFNGT